MQNLLALDVGTSSVRIFLGNFDGSRLKVLEKYRFYHESVEVPGGVNWPMTSIYQRLEEGINAVCGETDIESLALDSWGTDMVAFDWHGELLTNGISTHDRRFDGIKESFFQRFPKEELYKRTGIQFLNWNSLYLLYDYAHRKPWLLESIDKFLFTPDAFVYFLTGVMNCDYTIASTSQMLNPFTRDWDPEICLAAGVGKEKLLYPKLGKALGPVRHIFSGKQPIVYSGCSHDTAAAVAGTSILEPNELFLICGSWAMLGIEVKTPVITPLSEQYAFSNEGGVEGDIRYLKNVMGMWLVQESRRQWQREGKEYTFAELAKLGAQAKPFQRAINVDDIRLRSKGNVPEVISLLCEESGQEPPQTPGEVIRCINDSLALRLRVVKQELELSSGRYASGLHIVAGGSQDAALCQAIADALELPVLAGPVEASAYGNCAVQLVISKTVTNLSQAREIIRRSIELKIYEPHSNIEMEELFQCHRTLFEGA